MMITDEKKIKTYYQALIERKQSYTGIFYAAIKTTSIFCISTCRARKPKIENVEFYPTVKDALSHGYRPCKICKPTENVLRPPNQVIDAIQLVKKSPSQKVSDFELRKNELSPELIRRWFKKNYGLTFQAYQRMFRINNAFQEMKNGKKATETAFDSGYESLSGFGYTFKKILGNSPQKSLRQNVILIERFSTPLGPMYVCADAQGICLLEFTDRRMLETEFRDLQKILKAQILVGENKHIKQAIQEISEYFTGKRKIFDVSLHTPGTPFQTNVWKKLQEIPYGSISTYQQQASNMHRPDVIRAIASANGRNRIAIIIPCHRVIGKNGKLIGYGGGLERKKWLLDFERANSAQQYNTQQTIPYP